MTVEALRFIPIIGATGDVYQDKNEHNFILDQFESDFCVVNASTNLKTLRIVPNVKLFCSNSREVSNKDVCIVVFQSKMLVGQFIKANEKSFMLVNDKSITYLNKDNTSILGVVVGIHAEVS